MVFPPCFPFARKLITREPVPGVMKILRLSCYFPPEPQMPAGPWPGISALTRAQVRRGHEVTLVSSMNFRYPPWDFGFPVHRVFGYGTHFFRTYAWTFGFSSLLEILRRARRGEVDLVHSHDFDVALVARARRRGLGVPLAAHCHDVRRAWWSDPGVFRGLQKRYGFLQWANFQLHEGGIDQVLEREAFIGADVIFTVSGTLKGELVHYLKIPPEKIVVVHNGVDMERFHPGLPAPENLPPGPRVLTLAGDHIRKGIWTVLHVARIFQGKGWPGTFLVGGAAKESVRRLAGPNVRFLGAIPHGKLPGWYGNCDVHFRPVLTTSFSKSIAESMACGLPVVASRVGGIPELVTPETGFLIPPDQPEAMARCLHELLEDPDMGRRMGEAGRRRILEGFTWDHVAERVEAGYRLVQSLS